MMSVRCSTSSPTTWAIGAGLPALVTGSLAIFLAFRAQPAVYAAPFAAIASAELALVVGSEGQGLGPAIRRRCDLLVRIPMRGAIGSLNAAVAGSILLFAAVAQRDPGGEGGTERPRPKTFDDLVEEYADLYEMSAAVLPGGDEHEAVRYQARIEAALRWILVGTGFLFLAYLGSKFVLEIILHR